MNGVSIVVMFGVVVEGTCLVASLIKNIENTLAVGVVSIVIGCTLPVNRK